MVIFRRGNKRLPLSVNQSLTGILSVPIATRFGISVFSGSFAFPCRVARTRSHHCSRIMLVFLLVSLHILSISYIRDRAFFHLDIVSVRTLVPVAFFLEIERTHTYSTFENVTSEP